MPLRATPVPLDRLRANRIALIKPSALGDIVHTLPVLEALRVRFPEAHLTWVVNRSFAPMIQGHPCLNDVLAFDRASMRKGLLSAIGYTSSFAKQIRRERFDLVLDLQGLLRSGLMTLFAGSPRRIGFANAREGATLAYTDRIAAPPLRQQHAVDRNWLVAEAFGVGHLPKQFRLPENDEANDWAREQLEPFPRPWLILGVGARWTTKRWSPEHFASLGARVQAIFGGTVLFIGSSDEAEISRQVRSALTGPTRDFVGRTTLPQLTALLRRVDAMVANDTGPLHLAAALGVPCVAPYTCTRVALHGPYSQSANCVETSVACGGSYLKKCGNMICMPELTADRLWPKLAETLDTWQRNNRSRSA
jgi:heptosyltransferase-1